MKRRVLLISGCILTMLTMAFTFDNTEVAKPLRSSGAPPGYSGDPAGGNLNCTSCHSGSEATNQSGWITSNIPETGYVPDQEYTITATVTMTGYSKFGFEISPQNSGGTFLGTLTNSGSENTLTANTSYITHTSSGTSGNGSKTWNFNWTAPGSGSDSVTFYGAFNAANGNSSTSGDIIFLSTLTVNENTASGIKDNNSHSTISLYPNPVHDILTIENDLPGKSSIELRSVNGQLIHSEIMEGYLYQTDLSSFRTGIYFVTIRSDGSIFTRKIIKF